VSKSSVKQNCKPLLKCRLPAINQKLSKTEESFDSWRHVTLAELPSKLIGQLSRPVLTCSLRVEWLHTLFVCSICRFTSVSTGTSYKQILSMRSGTWWSQSRRHGGFDGLNPPKQCSRPPKLKYETLQISWVLSIFTVSNPPAQMETPLLKTFWRRFWVERSYTAHRKNWARLTTFYNY